MENSNYKNENIEKKFLKRTKRTIHAKEPIFKGKK